MELEAEDVMPADEESSGQQVFGWNNARWSFEGLAACPRLLLPTFHRLRADKEFTPQAVRFAQLTGRDLAPPAASVPFDEKPKTKTARKKPAAE